MLSNFQALRITALMIPEENWVSPQQKFQPDMNTCVDIFYLNLDYSYRHSTDIIADQFKMVTGRLAPKSINSWPLSPQLQVENTV